MLRGAAQPSTSRRSADAGLFAHFQIPALKTGLDAEWAADTPCLFIEQQMNGWRYRRVRMGLMFLLRFQDFCLTVQGDKLKTLH